MRSSLDHLPAAKQEELQHVVSKLRTGFESSTAGGTQPWRRNAKIQKIILFGSFARNDWVDKPENGYQSDWDLLIIVNHEKLTDVAEFWYEAEDRILRDPYVHRAVNIIVHTLSDVNEGLLRGEYFWTDLYRDGVVLLEVPGHRLAQPRPSSPVEAYAIASRFYEEGIPSADRAFELSNFSMAKGLSDRRWRKEAAFNLHQAVERLYACFLLVSTFYLPRSHNIKFLRALAEDQDKRLVAGWPREARVARRRFELLKRAYVEARYSDVYEISEEDLRWIFEAAEQLRTIVDQLCHERLIELASA